MTFQQYMKRVDAELMGFCNLTSEDLSDVAFRDMFDDEVTPYHAALECLEQSDFPMDML